MGGNELMKRIFQIVFAALLISVLATGCGQDQQKSSKSQENKNEATAKKAEPQQQEKDLSSEEIITKSGEVMKDWPGMDYKMTGQTNIHAVQGEEEMEIKQDLNLNAKVTMDPITMQISGDISMEDQKIPMNSYYKDKTMYQEVPEQGWVAIEGMDFDALQENSQAQNPAEQMKQYKDLIGDLQGKDGKKNEYVVKTEEDGMYVITLDLNKEALLKIKDQANELIEKSMGEQMQQMAGDALKNMEYKSMKVTLYIDKNSFEQKKMNQKIGISMKQDGATMNMDSDINMNSIKKFDGDITIPADVKNNAQKVSFDELQQQEKQQQQ